MRTLRLVALVALSAALAGRAGAVTIGFEGVAPPGGSVVPVTPYVEAGFTFTSNPPGPIEGIFSATAPGLNSNGTDVFGWCANLCGTDQTISASSGATFSFQRFDASNLSPGAFEPGMAIEVTGNLDGGGTVVQTFELVQDTWLTFDLAPTFVNLVSVDFRGLSSGEFAESYGFDNLVFDEAAVPEPSAALLFGLGFGVYGWVTRRRARD